MTNRIKELRKALGLSQEEFGNRLGLTRGAITNLEYGKTEAKPLFIDLVCKTYGVRRDWLLNGDGDMLEPDTRDQEISKFVSQVIKDKPGSFKRRFALALSRLDEDGWKALERFANMIAEEEKEE